MAGETGPADACNGACFGTARYQMEHAKRRPSQPSRGADQNGALVVFLAGICW
jgi:hypothetical protein